MLVVGGDEAFELFGPIQDPFDSWSIRRDLLDHEESLAVWAHVVLAPPAPPAIVRVRKDRFRDSHTEGRLGGKLGGEAILMWVEWRQQG